MAISRSFGATLLTTRSPIEIWPLVMPSNPAIILSRVDFPQPDGPTRVTNSPSTMSMFTPCKISVEPNDLRTSRIPTDAIVPPERCFCDALRETRYECAVCLFAGIAHNYGSATKSWCKVILMANTTPCRNAQQASVQRCGYGADARAALRFMEDLLQPDVGADRLAAGGNQQVDLVGRQLQARRDSVQPGA